MALGATARPAWRTHTLRKVFRHDSFEPCSLESKEPWAAGPKTVVWFKYWLNELGGLDFVWSRRLMPGSARVKDRPAVSTQRVLVLSV